VNKLSRTILTLFALQICSMSLGHAASQTTVDWRHYVIAHPEAVYPEVVKRTGMQGLGIFLVSIDSKDGTVTEVKVLKSTGYKKLDAIYVLNFFQWRFQPGTITWARIPRGVHVLGRANIYHEYH
jgi:TonB family protein